LREAASNRLYRFAQILEHAINLYNGDEETALIWLKTPNVAFDNSTPLELLSSEVGSDLVDGLITQLELGILPA
jgi:putative toxin-antitoxin system antitoxin component (TIGR02293 family)